MQSQLSWNAGRAQAETKEMLLNTKERYFESPQKKTDVITFPKYSGMFTYFFS